MRVCLVCPYDLAVPGGVNKHVLSLARELRAAGDEVDVIGPATPGPNLGPHVTGFPGVVSIRANESDNRLGLLVSPMRVRRFIRQRRFDVVHVHEPLAVPFPSYVVWASGRPARVCTFHRYTEREGMLTRTARLALGSHLRAFDAAIAVSPQAAQYARVSWSRPLSVVPNGVDVKFFAPSARTPGTRAVRLLFVGQWMDRRKGLSVLVDALQRLQAGGVEATLDVVGNGGPEPRDLERRTPGAFPRGVTVHGIVSEEELRRLLHAADVFVAPSLGCESFGMVLLEAMAAGCAVVCSDIDGYRSVTSKEGAWLVPAGDPVKLGEALAALAVAPERRHRMGNSNLGAARQYDWRAIAARIREEYARASASETARRRRQPASLAESWPQDRPPRPDAADAGPVRSR